VTVRPEWVEIGWTDRDGDRGHVIVGTGVLELGAGPGTIARITVQPLDSGISYPVDLPRPEAESLRAALGMFLDAEGPDGG
jgi:hypothetical protein